MRNPFMQIRFCGGMQTVIGSQILITVNDALRSKVYENNHYPAPDELFNYTKEMW